MKVLIIPEDPTLDQFILKPVVEQIFADLGRRAQVEVLPDPHLRSINQALDAKTLSEIISDNRMCDLFLLMVDRDCNRWKNEEKARQRELEHTGLLIACLAIEEVEVWMLALHRERLNVPWGDVLNDCDPKERFADPFLRQQGWTTLLGRGRQRAMRDLGARWKGLLTVCPELGVLKQRIQVWLSSNA